MAHWLWMLLSATSVLNPIIYCLMDKTFRQAIFRVGNTGTDKEETFQS